MISEKHTWNILGDHFKKNGFVSHQTGSFDQFIDVGIPRIVTEEPDICIEPKSDKDKKYKQYRVSFSNIYIPSPTIIEENRELRGINPSEARQRNLTYDSPIYATITETLEAEGQEPEITTHQRVVIGRIPIMLRSSRCYLTDMTPEQRVEAGECAYDEGGYFIVKGNERVIVAQLRNVYNIPLVLEQKPGEKYKYVCEMRSMSEETGHSVCVQAVVGVDNRTLAFCIPYIKDPIPFGVVFKALGYTSEQIVDLIGLESEHVDQYIRLILNDAFFVEELEDGYAVFVEENTSKFDDIPEVQECRNAFEKKHIREKYILEAWDELTDEKQEEWRFRSTQVNALKYIGMHATNQVKDSERCVYAQQVVDNEIFPHLGINSTSREKAYILGIMINKLLSTLVGMRVKDDRDNYVNKRVESTGVLCHELFRQLFKKYTNNIVSQIEKKKQLPDAMSIIPRLTDITKGFRNCFGTGNWGVPKNSYVRAGVSQVLSVLSYGAKVSSLRRIAIPGAKESKNTEIRQINPSQIMFVCPVETPEGAPVGIVLNLSLLTRISERTPTVLVREAIELCDHITFVSNFDGPNEDTKVFLNGILVGMTDRPEDLIDQLRKLRWSKMIPWDVSFSYDDMDDEIKICSDEGRLLRPVFNVSEDKLACTEEDGSDWDELIEKGLIVYIDVMEANNAVIAFNQNELVKYRCDYCEIAAAMMLGVMASIIPFPDHSQSPRNTYQAAMGKQAMSMFALSHLIRTDTVVHVLGNPQRPLVGTKAGEMMGFHDMPSGINTIVAIACYTGFNQEDSVILNHSAIQRGLFWATTYKTISVEEKKDGNSSERIGVPPLDKRRHDANYGLLDEKGIVRARHPTWTDENGKKCGGGAVYVQKGDVIIGKTFIHSDKDGGQEITDCSVVIEKGKEGYIDRIYTSITPNGYLLVKVVIRKVRIPEIGDKFASRAAQKGTVGMVYAQHDMPFTCDGISPDIIINPHCLTGDTVVELYDGTSVLIKDIYNKTNIAITTINPDTFEYSETNFTDGFVKTPTSLLAITTTSGRVVKCTPEHMWLIIRGKNILWVETKDLCKYSDKIITSNCVLPVTGSGQSLIVTKGSGKYWKRLEELDLIGIIPDSKASILARLIGALDSDGHLQMTNLDTGSVRCILYLGEMADYNEVCRDMKSLGFKIPTIRKNLHCYRVELEVACGVLLGYLGACFGNKTTGIRTFPNWILYASDTVKREFLSGYQGGDGSKFVVNKSTVQQQIRVRPIPCRTRNDVKESHLQYIECIRSLFTHFDILTTIQTYKTDKPDYTDFKLAISLSPPNLIRLSEIIGYRYCNHKRRESQIAIEFLRSRENGFRISYKHFVECFVYNGMTTTFIQDITEVPIENVYDFTTISNNHSFIANGMVSHNCIPSRMTINQLMETVLGKSCLVEGTFGDATPFTESSTPNESGQTKAEQLANRLQMNGYSRCGNEILHNGMTGERMGSFFIGPVYYQRLKHLVEDKMHARSTGPVTTLTRQPPEGRSREGGLRFGEMERDCMIGHGATEFLNERLFKQSDYYTVVICQKCGNFAFKNHCQACETDEVVTVKYPYVGKLVTQELNAMMIKTKIVAKD